jgi:UDP-glucose 4-epimerase
MRIAITGAAGLIGSAAQTALRQAGEHQLTLLYRNTLPDNSAQENCIKGDLSDGAVCDALVNGQDVIMHLAHESTPLMRGKDLVADAVVNLLPSLQLIQAIEKTGRCPHVIYISSGGAVYGSTLDHHPSKEEDPCTPSLIYGIQKLAIEHYLHAAAEKGILRATILRVANAYGALLPPLRMQGLIGTAVSRATMGLPLRLLGNPENIRDYVHVSDVAQALVLALKNPAPFDIFNIGSGKKTSVMEILALIRTISGSDLPIQSEELPENQTLPDCCLLDISKAEQKLGWRAQIHLEEGIRAMFSNQKNCHR